MCRMKLGTCLLMAMLLAAVPVAMADRPDGCDVSHWNGDITVSEWQQAYNAGKVFAFCKASQGTWYTDTEFYDNMTRAPQAGVLIGPYHFAEPQYNSAVDEADYFVSVAGDYITNGYLRPVLDLEWGSELSKAALSAWVNDWMDRVEELTGVEPIIYTNTNYATYELDSSVADRDLWIAQYWYDPDPENGEPSIGVFNSWAFWQWTESCSIPGIGSSEDCDVFNGTMSELEANFVIGGGSGSPPAAFIVESRSGGQHYANYSETGTWGNNNSYKSSAPGCTAGIGHRWCTLNSESKTAVFRFTPTQDGTYEIFTTNCTTSNSGNPLIHQVEHEFGTANVGVCQNTTCSPNAVNVWYSLGEYVLYADTEYTVTLNGDTDVGSGPANNAGRSDAIKWQWVSDDTTPPPPEDYIVESRSGGQHYDKYSETGTWGNNNSYKSSAEGCTAGIGHRWCTLDSNSKTAVFSFTPTADGTYEIYTTNCTTSNSGNPLIHQVQHAGGTTNVGVCQNTTCSPNAVNVWYSLGQYPLYAGVEYTVTLNGDTDIGSGPSGNAGRSDAIKWSFVSSDMTPAPYIVESRAGGLNYDNYSETGTWSNGSSKSSAEGTTAGIGHRWCTLNSTAKSAVFSYTPFVTGTYEIFTTNCTTWNSGNPLIHHVEHAGGTTNVGVCQNADCNPTAVNVWYSLGQYTLNAGTTYDVILDGDTDSGTGPVNNAGRSDAIKWEYVGN